MPSKTEIITGSISDKPIETCLIFDSQTIKDPTYRINILAAANNTPVSIKPNEEIQKAVLLMMAHDYSQLPVMTSEREVKGIISWKSIGKQLTSGKNCIRVQECMDACQIIENDRFLFEVIGLIAEHEYVLIRNKDKKICGIVTPYDLSLTLRDLGEPFLLLEEIENHIRELISSKFSLDELRSAQDMTDTDRKIESVSDLTFGEYLRLLENQKQWEKLGLSLDRKTFIAELQNIREIRNSVMHFNPAGINKNALDNLHRIVKLFRDLRKIYTAK